MQCSVRKESVHYGGNSKMKAVHNYKNNKKEGSSEQTGRGRQSEHEVGMPIEHAEAVRRYYAAFPALVADPPPRAPPAWCRAPAMQPALARPRRNSHRRRKRGTRAQHDLPEWFTHEGTWDMELQDPVREFIRAIALDEGYGTCEPEEPPATVPVPEPEPEPEPLDRELYARFEAKFDRSLEALWDRDTPEDDLRELPIDIAALLASPSDRLWDTVWAPSPPLHARLRPLHLASPPPVPPAPPAPPAPLPLDPFALYDGDELYEALAAVADTLRSLAAINHARDTSGFVEVPPRRRAPAPPPPAPPVRAPPAAPPEDLLTSARTHFRPIGEWECEARYADGATFPPRAELCPAEFERSESGGAYLGSARYLEYRAAERERGVDYARLGLTAAQQAAAGALPLRFPLRQRDVAAQTSPRAASPRAHTPPPAPPPDRKRRHSAALRCAPHCDHPHARFLPCCALHRPLTR